MSKAATHKMEKTARAVRRPAFLSDEQHDEVVELFVEVEGLLTSIGACAYRVTNNPGTELGCISPVAIEAMASTASAKLQEAIRVLSEGGVMYEGRDLAKET